MAGQIGIERRSATFGCAHDEKIWLVQMHRSPADDIFFPSSHPS
jgi:hypothetical protein